MTGSACVAWLRENQHMELSLGFWLLTIRLDLNLLPVFVFFARWEAFGDATQLLLGRWLPCGQNNFLFRDKLRTVSDQMMPFLWCVCAWACERAHVCERVMAMKSGGFCPTWTERDESDRAWLDKEKEPWLCDFLFLPSRKCNVYTSLCQFIIFALWRTSVQYDLWICLTWCGGKEKRQKSYFSHPSFQTGI